MFIITVFRVLIFGFPDFNIWWHSRRIVSQLFLLVKSMILMGCVLTHFGIKGFENSLNLKKKLIASLNKGRTDRRRC